MQHTKCNTATAHTATAGSVAALRACGITIEQLIAMSLREREALLVARR